MTKSLTIAPKNSMLLVMDRSSGVLPPFDEFVAGRFAASPACALIGTYEAQDGETRVVITNERSEAAMVKGWTKLFEGRLATPNKELHVCTVLREIATSAKVAGASAQVEIWANDPPEPNEIFILVDGDLNQGGI